MRTPKKGLIVFVGLFAAITSAHFIQAQSNTSKLVYELPDNGGLSASTANTASEVTRGYGRIQPEIGRTAPAGLAIFGFTSGGVLVSEAGVPASPLTQAGRIYAEVAGAVNTGLAIANPNGSPATITFNFTDSAGTDFGSGTITIAAGGQIAKFLNQDPFNSGDIVNGTFTFNSDVLISVIALRGFINERGDLLITTLPVAPLGTTSTVTSLFPHFAVGGGWITQVILVNPTDGILTGRIEFFSQGSDTVPGAPATVTIDGVSASSFTYSIPGRSARRFVPSGASMVTTSGSVRIVPDPGNSAPSGLGVFSFKPNLFTVAEAGVPLLEPATSVRMYAESAASIQTGVAIANPSSSPSTVTFELTTLPGASTGLTGTATIPGNGQIATFLDQISGFEELTTPFQGVLRISTTSTAGLSVVGLRSHVNERADFLITTTSPVDENATASTDEQLFPHFAYGDGWSTQFILFDGSGASTSGNLHFLSSAGESSDVRLSDISTVKMIGPFSHPSPQGVTAEGHVGLWMHKQTDLSSMNGIADWVNGWDRYKDKNYPGESWRILEPINVVWIDFTASTEQQAKDHLEHFLEAQGEGDPTRTKFSKEGGHSDGYWAAYAYNELLNIPLWMPQYPHTKGVAWVDIRGGKAKNHGRIFPSFEVTSESGDPVYITSGAFSRETVLHLFESFDDARDVLVAPDGWVDKGVSDFENSYGPSLLLDFTTADHSGVRIFALYPDDECADISGLWNGRESGTLTESFTALGETDTDTSSFRGAGTITINQVDCNISYLPIPVSGLVPKDLTPQQWESVRRTGTIEGNNFSVSGPAGLLLVELGREVDGITITSVNENHHEATGTITNGEIFLEGTSRFVVSGRALDESGVRQAFTFSASATSKATLSRSGQADSGSWLSICADASCSSSISDEAPTDQMEVRSLVESVKQRILWLQ